MASDLSITIPSDLATPSVLDEPLINWTTRSNGVAIIRLNRLGKRNMFTQLMINDLVSRLNIFNQDESVRAVVIAGAAGGPFSGSYDSVFSAGLDLNELAGLSPSEARERDLLWDLTDAFVSFRKPLIAAVEGCALGLGFEIALMCDIIYASPESDFGFPETRVGTIPGAGGTQHLARLIGKHKTMELVLTGTPISGSSLEVLGAVSRTFPGGRVVEEATKIAIRIANMSGPIMNLAKRAVLDAYESSLRVGLEKEKSLFYSTFDLSDCKEGISAFLDKREPDFGHVGSPMEKKSPTRITATRVLSSELAVFSPNARPNMYANGSSRSLASAPAAPVSLPPPATTRRGSEKKRDSLLVRVMSMRVKGGGS